MLLFRYFVTYYYSLQDGKVNRIVFGYTQFHSVILALAIFVFIRYMVSGTEFLLKMVEYSVCCLVAV